MGGPWCSLVITVLSHGWSLEQLVIKVLSHGLSLVLIVINVLSHMDLLKCTKVCGSKKRVGPRVRGQEAKLSLAGHRCQD